MADTFDWSALTVRDEARAVVITPCLALTLVFRVAEASDLLDFHDRVMEALGPLFTHYQAEAMKHPAKITPRARTTIPTWIRKPAEFKFYFAEFRGAKDIHGASFEIHYQDFQGLTPAQQERYRQNLPLLVKQGLTTGTGLQTSTFRVTVPLDHPFAAPERFARWALEFEAVKNGEFVTAACDYSLNYEGSWGDIVVTPAKSLCMRHPGLDFFDSRMSLWLHRYEPERRELLPLVKRASWITFVNERAVDYLGGEAKLAGVLSEDASVRLHHLAHGLALQSGDAPRPGDLSRLDIPYRSVAAAIRPVRLERVGSVGYEDEWMSEWLGLLDQPLPGEQR